MQEPTGASARPGERHMQEPTGASAHPGERRRQEPTGASAHPGERRLLLLDVLEELVGLGVVAAAAEAIVH